LIEKLNMEYRLRGHHLICLQFYKGEGYNDDFVENLDKVVKSWQKNPVKVVDFADDVCQKCPFLKEEKCTYKKGEKEIGRIDKLAFKLLKVKFGDKVEKKTIEEKIPMIIKVWRKKACQDCDWKKVCETRLTENI